MQTPPRKTSTPRKCRSPLSTPPDHFVRGPDTTKESCLLQHSSSCGVPVWLSSTTQNANTTDSTARLPDHRGTISLSSKHCEVSVLDRFSYSLLWYSQVPLYHQELYGARGTTRERAQFTKLSPPLRQRLYKSDCTDNALPLVWL